MSRCLLKLTISTHQQEQKKQLAQIHDLLTKNRYRFRWLPYSTTLSWLSLWSREPLKCKYLILKLPIRFLIYLLHFLFIYFLSLCCCSIWISPLGHQQRIILSYLICNIFKELMLLLFFPKHWITMGIWMKAIWKCTPCFSTNHPGQEG